MFTGLVEAVGETADVKETAGGLRLRVRTALASDLAPADSIAVNGVCLTVTAAEGGDMFADIGPETARITTLGSLRRGQPVNLERAMRADSRFGGHFVQGHVDATGVVDDLRAEGDAHWMTVTFPEALASYFVKKGSVAVDGVSLTVAGLGRDRFDVMIIPFTWDHTTFPSLRAGSRVNLECDMVGKYVARAAELFRAG
jgi:riboflavin synthase alpha subunit